MSSKEDRERIELLQGTLDLLILRTLLLGPRHGHAIAKAIEFNSDEVLQVEQGSLYPALHRLIKRRWIAVEEGMSENNRRAKFYRLTSRNSNWRCASGTNSRERLRELCDLRNSEGDHVAREACAARTRRGHSRTH